MIRKPKIHPKYGLDLVGINFRERWNIVEYATKEELCRYIANYEHINKIKRNYYDKSWWDQKTAVINQSTQNNYLRKLWRKRHSESFQKDVLYKVSKNIARWSTKLGPTYGDGLATSYHFDRSRQLQLVKNDIIILLKVDELGNLYFAKISEINAPHPYAFNRDNANLGFIVQVES